MPLVVPLIPLVPTSPLRRSRSSPEYQIDGIQGMCYTSVLTGKNIEVSKVMGGTPTWWLIPLSKWVLTPVINGISRVNPLIIGVITHLLSGMSHQVVIIQLSSIYRWDEISIYFDGMFHEINQPTSYWQ